MILGYSLGSEVSPTGYMGCIAVILHVWHALQGYWGIGAIIGDKGSLSLGYLDGLEVAA